MHLSQLRVVHTNPMKNFQAYLWWPSFVKPQVNTFSRSHLFFLRRLETASLSGPSRRARSYPESGRRKKWGQHTSYRRCPAHGFLWAFFTPGSGSGRVSRYRSVHTLPHTRTHPTGIRSIYVKMEKMRHFSSKIERKHSAPAARADTVLRTQQNK